MQDFQQPISVNCHGLEFDPGTGKGWADLTFQLTDGEGRRLDLIVDELNCLLFLRLPYKEASAAYINLSEVALRMRDAMDAAQRKSTKPQLPPIAVKPPSIASLLP